MSKGSEALTSMGRTVVEVDPKSLFSREVRRGGRRLGRLTDRPAGAWARGSALSPDA